MAKTKKLSKNYMECVFVPRKDLKWNEKEDSMIELAMENKGFYHWIAQKFFRKPKVSYISLDTYGSTLWKMLDGKNTVQDVVEHMEQEFPQEKDRMLDRVVTFMSILQNNKFVERKM